MMNLNYINSLKLISDKLFWVTPILFYQSLGESKSTAPAWQQVNARQTIDYSDNLSQVAVIVTDFQNE